MAGELKGEKHGQADPDSCFREGRRTRKFLGRGTGIARFTVGGQQGDYGTGAQPGGAPGQSKYAERFSDRSGYSILRTLPADYQRSGRCRVNGKRPQSKRSRHVKDRSTSTIWADVHLPPGGPFSVTSSVAEDRPRSKRSAIESGGK